MRSVFKWIFAGILAFAATGLIAVIFYFSVVSLHDLSKYLSRFSIRVMFWSCAAIIYFGCAIAHWKRFIEYLGDRNTWRRPQDIFFVFLMVLFTPVGEAIARSVGFLKSALSLFTAPIHEDFRRIVDRCIGIWILIWLWIYVVLIIANAGRPIGEGCKWVFPRILSCLLNDRESLAAGLVGAGGAIFAAWLAWVAIQQQFSGKSSSDDEESP
jgi:hypothetical protein